MEVSVEFQQQVIAALAALKKDESWLNSSFAIGLLTAGSAIVATWLQKRQAFQLQERQSEIEKALRLHAFQLEALKSLSAIEHEVTPRKEPSPGADNYEYLSPIVSGLSAIVENLNKYLLDHGYISPSSVCNHIDSAIAIANMNKWVASQANTVVYEPSDEEISGVNKLINEIKNAVTEFKMELGVQKNQI